MGRPRLPLLHDGRIEPLGDLARDSVADVSRGARFAAIRERMWRERLASCHHCDILLEESRALARALPEAAPAKETTKRALRVLA